MLLSIIIPLYNEAENLPMLSDKLANLYLNNIVTEIFFIDELNGLPGPFIKFFEERLGKGAAIKLLGNSDNRNAKQICAICFYDGKELIFEEAEMIGRVTHEVKEGYGFGFDFCFIPEGYNKTFSELGLDEKNKISARKKVIDKIKKSLERSA